MERNSCENEFQSFDATILNALSPSVAFDFIVGVARRRPLEHLRLQADDLIVINSVRYIGASPWIVLKVIRCLIGSQCRSRNSGVKWQNLVAGSQATGYCSSQFC